MSLKVFGASTAFVLLALAIPILATGVENNGEIDHVFVANGSNFETSSGDWQTVDTVNMAAEGPVSTFSLTGQGYAQDFGQGGVFRGEKYAAMQVRLQIGQEILKPGAMTFVSNAGVVKSRTPRAMGNTLKWFWENPSVEFPVTIQARGFNPNDISGLKRWYLEAIVRDDP